LPRIPWQHFFELSVGSLTLKKGKMATTETLSTTERIDFQWIQWFSVPQW
jgi:hypothetical protein